MDHDETPGSTAGGAIADDAADAAAEEEDTDQRPGLLDRMRGTGVGTEDPNIVGDAGPFDVAPGADPDGGGLPVQDR